MLQRQRSGKGDGYQPIRNTSPERLPKLGRHVSPGPEHTKRPQPQGAIPTRPLDRTQRVNQPTVNRTIAPGQASPGMRSKEKFISLPEELAEPAEQLERALSASVDVPQTLFEDIEAEPPSARGRITIYCLAESLDRKLLQRKLEERGSRFLLHKYPDVLYGQYSTPGAEHSSGDIFYFDYGCITFWGLSQKQEQDVLRNLVVPCMLDPLPGREVEVDEFQVHYTANEKPHIQNDTITINHRFVGDHLIKLSISHALSQSTKLCVFEERVIEIVASTKDLPEILASTGSVTMSRKAIAQLIGKVFIQKAAVNLLSTVLDTPEFFWSAPDSMQTLYKRVCEYMELDDRVEVLNNRFQVLQEMLDMLRNHQNNSHTARLEWIVIYLIVIEVIIGIFECLSIVGLVGKH
ncbi:hypothetical protein WJX81_000989 [Elliptochloris bilobata]|uniref:DUF155 domain-containing protein n=1 Tax=Elliptochloris bilobata TaxID=381761 RepID=A0AAW1QL13_9CHLO